MNNQLQFIQKSNIAEYYFALFIDTSNEIKAITEYVLYYLVKNMESSPDEALFYTIQTDSDNLVVKVDDFGSELKDV